MKTFLRRAAAAVILFSVVLFCVSAENYTSVENLHEYELDNGLKLFAVENHLVPLVYIEIAVKCGSVTQTPENAGLFHLYEHMMFKGNSQYKDAAAVQRALADLGISSWNGSTGIECVNYYFTVPSEHIESGLKFWSSAIRTPRINKKELESEKKVVLAEIQGNESDPGRVLNSASAKLMFPEAPWKIDPAGSEVVVKNATVKQLKEIQKKYYVPNNAALFVGGDIDPDEVYRLVNEIYGSWKRGRHLDPAVPKQMNTAPLSAPEFRVMPYDQISDQLAEISITYRGPDADFARSDTYAADILSNCIDDPRGYFKKNLVQNPLLMIDDTDYIWGGYGTSRYCGEISFGVMVSNPEQSLPERARYLFEKLPGLLRRSIPSDSEDDDVNFSTVRQRIADSMIYGQETAGSILSSLRFWWVCTDSEYYFTYQDNLNKISGRELTSFIDRYIAGKNPLITVLVNPSIYEETKKEFAEHGFKEITAEESFWWKTPVSAADEGESK